MMLNCTLLIEDITGKSLTKRPIRSCVMIKQLNDEYYFCVKNSTFPNQTTYKFSLLQNIFSKFLKEGKLGLKFSAPRHSLLMEFYKNNDAFELFQIITKIIEGKNVTVVKHIMPKKLPAKNGLINRFDPKTLEFVSIKHFDNRILNMKYLKKLVLENCDLPKIPFQLGQLSIEYLSISGSKLPTSIYKQNFFWNWTSSITICNSLTTLKMDSIDLKKLPFEIFFLKNLKTLSVSKNKLSYLPQFIGDLKKLECLLVADNSLIYFPHVLSRRTFKEIDISNNSFQLPRSLQFDHIKMYLKMIEIEQKTYLDVKPLSHLAFYKLMDNWTPFRRQDIPHTLWIYFDVVGRCMLCNKWILPNYSRITHTFDFPTAISLIRDHVVHGIPWQSLICSSSYDCEGQV